MSRTPCSSSPASDAGHWVLPAPWGLLLAAGLVMSLALLGIFTRPSGLLAAFWPANAVLLGLLVRAPGLVTLPVWAAVTAAFVAADLLTGATWAKATLLTAANLSGVGVGLAALRRMPAMHVRLQHPASAMYLLGVCLMASAASGLVGAAANPLLFGGSALQGLLTWFTAELVNYLAILPMMLSAPARWPTWRAQPGNPAGERRQRPVVPRRAFRRLAPLLALVGGLALGVAIGGPGAIVYFVPGLLWCALSYSLFTTTVLTLLSSTWTLMAVSTGHLVLGPNAVDGRMLESLRLGVTLICLSPLTVACAMAGRNALLRKLERAATHDPLTGVLNRGGFGAGASALLAELQAAGRPVAVLMLDLDHFKRINDTLGHAAGDAVLQAFATVAGRFRRESDLLGRLGGEEFVLLLPDCTPEQARGVAQRICDAFAGEPMQCPEGQPLAATVSVGVAHAARAPAAPDELLRRADRMLYAAKQAGRNRVSLVELTA